MIFRNRNKSHEQFIRPRPATVQLELALTAGELLWAPANTWENADTFYFAASASPLQILSYRPPTDYSLSSSRTSSQPPNIAGRWVLKLNPAQIKKDSRDLTNEYFGWAETHVTYSTFATAEVVFWLADELSEGESTAIGNALRALLGAHCVALQSAGSLRVLPIGKIAVETFTDFCLEPESTEAKTIWNLGELSRSGSLAACPKYRVFDVTPPLWGTRPENAAAKASLNWLQKRLARQQRDVKRKPS